MILLIDQRTVIVTPPKTGSDTLHRTFCSGPPWNGLMVTGPHHDVWDKHCCTVPAEGSRFKKLLCVRNPYDRLVSLWCHKNRLNVWDGNGTGSFAQYVHRVAAGREPTWLFRCTISELVGNLQPDGLLRAESLRDDLADHGLAVESLPRFNESYRRPWEAYYTPDLLARIGPWAAADCERWGYPITARSSLSSDS